MTRMFGSIASLFTVATLASACMTEPEVGKADFSLTGQSPSGVHYRLRDAELTISGDGVTQVFHSEDAPDAPTISTSLSEGDYAVLLADGWYLERIGADGTATRVEASRVSPNPLPFTIHAGTRTPVTLRFQAGDEPVGMSNGDADIGIEVGDMGWEAQGIVLDTDNLITLSEGTSSTFHARFARQPSQPVSINLTSSDPAVIVIPEVLTFSPLEYDQYQAVTITAVRDANTVSETGTVRLSVTGGASRLAFFQVIDID
jgi:hypothetical protein